MRRRATALLAGIWLATAVGCASFTVPSVTRIFEREEPVVTPTNVAVVWTTAVLSQTTGTGTRGFGGLVTFYTDDQKNPVRVDGELTVYAYDEASCQSDKSQPDRKYVFTREQLQKHYGKGSLGASYHIWIPWDQAGCPRREVSLVLRFDPAEGRLVIAKPTHAVLPGPNDAKDQVKVSRSSQATQISLTAAVSEAKQPDNAASPRPQMRTMTLDLPRATTTGQVASVPPTVASPPQNAQPAEGTAK